MPMRVRLIALTAFALLVFVAARAQNSRVKELAPGVYFWQGDRELREPANCTWIVFKDYVLVIDANFPWGARKILPQIKAVTNKPIRFVFDTHYHGDHTYGNSVFTDQGAAILCSADCAEELRTKGERGFTNYKDQEHPLTGAHFEPATITFSDAMVFDDGTHRVEITKVGPGHSKGDSIAYLPKEKILVTGDLCVTWSSGNNVADPDADHDNWVRALDRMSKLDAKIVIPGHGTPAGPEALRAQAGYLSDMISQVRSGKRAGKTADQLAAEIDLSKHGNFAADKQSNASSIRAMYRKL
jgi:cyclase